jgi:hypothetical protein
VESEPSRGDPELYTEAAVDTGLLGPDIDTVIMVIIVVAVIAGLLERSRWLCPDLLTFAGRIACVRVVVAVVAEDRQVIQPIG